jgi:conjugal transfer/entry exclusion protein
MSKKKSCWSIEDCATAIWQQCCVRSTTRQKIYIEMSINRLLKQIKGEIDELNLYQYNINKLDEVFNKYLN